MIVVCSRKLDLGSLSSGAWLTLLWSFIGDMRTNYKFQLFSGEGNVDYGPNRVVLNGFSQDVMDISNLWEWSFKYIYKRLMRVIS